MVKREKGFIQKAKLKKGALSKQLGIPEKENIPITLLHRIKKAKRGTIVHNPTKIGKRKVKATTLLKQRSNLAITLKNIKMRSR